MYKKNIILVGQSLGTGIVAEYVSKNEWTTPIVLISPYKTIASVVTDSSFKEMVDKFKTIKKLKHISCPVKIIHGQDDNIIHISHGQEIYNKLNESCKMKPLWIPSCGHNDILTKIGSSDWKEVLFYS